MLSLLFQLIKKIPIKIYVITTILIAAFSLGWESGLTVIAILILYALIKNVSSIFAYIAKTKYSQGLTKEALVWLDRAYTLGKPTPGTTVLYAYLLLKEGMVGKSDEILHNLLKKKLKESERLQAQSNYALVLWKKGRLDEAVELLEMVFESYKNTTIYGSLGFLLILQGNFEKALKFNREAYEYNNTNHIILDNLGQNFYHLGNFTEADEIYKKFIDTNPAFPEAYYNYGLVLEKLNNPEAANECFEKALNFKFSYLSGVTRNEVEQKIKKKQGDGSCAS